MAAASALDLEIRFEGMAPSFGGFDSADFLLHRPHRPQLECNLRLAQDARALVEARTGPLSDRQLAALMLALAERYYPAVMANGAEPPAIETLRARDLERLGLDGALRAAGLG